MNDPPTPLPGAAARACRPARRSAPLPRRDQGTSAAQRERLLSATERLQQTGDKIEEGKRVLMETEDVGVNILRDLHKQKQTIVSARETVHETDDYISRSRKVLATMSRRLVRPRRGEGPERSEKAIEAGRGWRPPPPPPALELPLLFFLAARAVFPPPRSRLLDGEQDRHGGRRDHAARRHHPRHLL